MVQEYFLHSAPCNFQTFGALPFTHKLISWCLLIHWSDSNLEMRLVTDTSEHGLDPNRERLFLQFVSRLIFTKNLVLGCWEGIGMWRSHFYARFVHRLFTKQNRVGDKVLKLLTTGKIMVARSYKAQPRPCKTESQVFCFHS